MRVRKQLVKIICLLFTGLFFVPCGYAGADRFSVTDVFADGCGGFYLLSGNTLVSRYGEKNAFTRRLLFEPDGMTSNSTDAFAVGRNDSILSVIAFSDKERNDEVIMLGAAQAKKDCIAVNDDRELFIVPANSDNSVNKYDLASGKGARVYSGRNIDRLLYCCADGAVYAVSDGRLLDIDKDEFIDTKIPALPFRTNGDLYCSSDGHIYRFEGTGGFSELTHIGECGGFCCTDEAVFILDGNTVIKQDFDGRVVASFTYKGLTVDDIAASGGEIALICGAEIIPLDEDRFAPVSDDSGGQSEPSLKSSSESGKSSKTDGKASSDASVYEQELSSVTSRAASVYEKERSPGSPRRESEDEPALSEYSGGISSDEYAISDGVIGGIPVGTTFAQLKKNISGIGSISYFNYKGRKVTGGKAGTGASVEITAQDGSVSRYYLVVPGDVTGEGSFNSNDAKMILRARTGEAELDACQLAAADMNRDGIFDIRDASILCGEYYGAS